jgi:hypothetical protein
VEIDPAELVLLIEGVDAGELRRRKRYRRPAQQEVRGGAKNEAEIGTTA